MEADEVVAAGRSGEEKIRRLEKATPQALGTLWSDVRLLVSIIRDYGKGACREILFGTIAATAAAILYLVSPIDTLPDFIPAIGYIDDAAVIALCLRMAHNDIEDYRAWRGTPSTTPEDA